MTDDEQTPHTVRLTNLSTGETAPLDVRGPIRIHLDEAPQDETPPFRRGGILPAGRLEVGEISHGCALPPRPQSTGPELVRVYPVGPVLTDEQCEQLRDSVARVSAEIRRALAAAVPLVRAICEELGRSVDAIAAAGLAQRNGPDGRPRRSGRDAQVSPYGPRQTRR